MDNTKQRLIPWRWSESNKRSLKKKKDGTENFISFNLDPETGEDLLHNLKPSASMRGQKKKGSQMPDPDHGEWWVKILKPILKSSGSQYKEDETKVYVIPFFFF